MKGERWSASLRERKGRAPKKNKSSEVVLGPFVSASSSRLDPCLTCYRCFPCGAAARDLHSGSGLTANRINLPNASELYLAFDWASRSPRPALGYRPLLALSPRFSAWRVISLEPRTPHQPEKLKKLSQNDYCSTPSKFFVNQKSRLATCVFSIECSESTGG
jgi:hypothetical protein